MDVHVRRAITVALLDSGVDVLTAQTGDAAGLEDPALLDRATSLGRVLFSQDEDLLAESGISFAGVVYAHSLYVTVGRCVSDLELIAKIGMPEGLANGIQFHAALCPRSYAKRTSLISSDRAEGCQHAFATGAISYCISTAYILRRRFL